MAKQAYIPGIRATKRTTTLVLGVARYGDIEVRKPAQELAHRLAHRFAFLLETYVAFGGKCPEAQNVPIARRVVHRAKAKDAPPVPLQSTRLRLLPSVDPAWAVALAEHVERVS